MNNIAVSTNEAAFPMNKAAVSVNEASFPMYEAGFPLDEATFSMNDAAISTDEATVGPAVYPDESSRETNNKAKPTEHVFSLAIVVSGIRCTLAYVIFPWVLPAVGVASGVGAGVGLTIGTVAVVFNLVSIRRFWRVAHPHKWIITVLNSSVIVLLLILAVIDLGELLT